jgi:hypothetical protein
LQNSFSRLADEKSDKLLGPGCRRESANTEDTAR